jgi:hypothetical protein
MASIRKSPSSRATATISAASPHDYQWLLQTDAPPAVNGGGIFEYKSGATPYRLHALRPAGVAHGVLEQEITANPTSAKADWIIRRSQYALALSPAEACCDCQYFVVLDLAGCHVESLLSERGLAATLSAEGQRWTAAFASGRDGILADGLNVDGRWFAGRQADGRLSQYLAGDVTSIWLDGELHFVADRPVNIALRQAEDCASLGVATADHTWLRVSSDRPRALYLNGSEWAYQYDEATGMIWLRVPAGRSELEIH